MNRRVLAKLLKSRLQTNSTCVQSVSGPAASSKAELHDEVGEDDGERELQLLHQP